MITYHVMILCAAVLQVSIEECGCAVTADILTTAAASSSAPPRSDLLILGYTLRMLVDSVPCCRHRDIIHAGHNTCLTHLSVTVGPGGLSSQEVAPPN